MDERMFQDLLQSVNDMGKHMRGEKITGTRTAEFPEPDVKAIRERAQVSQAEFARLIGINVRTLQNWEQKRVHPTGPARALLKIVEANPRAAIEALHS